MLHDVPGQNSPLSAAEEQALELEGERDRSSLIERLKASDNLYEQAECLQKLVLLLGQEGEISWSHSGAHASGQAAGSSIRLEALLDQLWRQASRGRHWGILRRIAGLREWVDPGLEEAVTNLLVRQKQILVGKGDIVPIR